jgi:ABC-2 type transport system permease protein
MSAPLRLRPRSLYLSLWLVTLQSAVSYRRALILNTLLSTIWVFVPYYLWRAVFARAQVVGPFDWPQMQTYVVLSYAINVLLNSSYWVPRLIGMIRSGDITLELMRPYDFLLAQLASALGTAVIEGALSGAIAVLLGALFLDLVPPPSPSFALAFAASVMLGFLIKFLLNYLVALLCFWTMNGLGLYWAQLSVINLLSGALLPLELFPGWAREAVAWLPFRGIIQLPLSLYLGKVTGAVAARELAFQLGWVVALFVLAKLPWGPSLRRLEIQGG